MLTCLIFFCLAQDLEQMMSDPIWMGPLAQEIKAGLDQSSIVVRTQADLESTDAWIRVSWDGTTEPLDRAALDIHVEGRFDGDSLQAVQVGDALWLKTIDGYRPLMEGQGRWQWLGRAGKKFVYRSGTTLWAFDPNDGSHVQIVVFESADEEVAPTGWAADEESGLIDYVRFTKDRIKRNSDTVVRHGGIAQCKPTLIGKDHVIGAMGYREDDNLMCGVSSDLSLAYVVAKPKDEGQPTKFAQFINEEAAVKALDARPTVGYDESPWRLGLVSLGENKTTWVDFSGLPDLKIPRRARIQKPEAPLGDPRPIFMAPGGFAKGSHELLVTVMTTDYKDRWIVLVNGDDGSYRVLHHHVDEAWLQYYLRTVDHSDTVTARAFWCDDNEVAFLSDEQGYQNLFAINTSDLKLRVVVGGSFEVYSPYKRNGHWYFHANVTHPGVRHFYRLKSDELERLTEGDGLHDAFFVGSRMVDLASEANRPPYIKVFENGAWHELYDGRSDAFKSISWLMPEYVTYPNNAGQAVYARLYRPENSNGAGVLFIHGAGYLQNAHKGWSDYFREYMFHNLLVKRGFTVLDCDYRASAGYGREWRTAIYRHMGASDLDDVLSGHAYLVEKGLKSDRIGVYGGSYGGFLTLMAMFKNAGTFACGAALRPVTDWAYYNHWYTSRILNTPKTDPEAYRRSSPIYFADGLQGELIICHGMVDDNVQFQDSVRLAQRLIELKKTGWSLHGFPVEPHGFVMPESWLNEYRRIMELFESNLVD
ncbi:MAG: prolyl oligopeptidase family serine peptidase [Acidobacteria bacterium]|nr:prolyl oligopeptidase family serine peptidase [Acidobacteriota bacterium]